MVGADFLSLCVFACAAASTDAALSVVSLFAWLVDENIIVNRAIEISVPNISVRIVSGAGRGALQKSASLVAVQSAAVRHGVHATTHKAGRVHVGRISTPTC